MGGATALRIGASNMKHPEFLQEFLPWAGRTALRSALLPAPLGSVAEYAGQRGPFLRRGHMQLHMGCGAMTRCDCA